MHPSCCEHVYSIPAASFVIEPFSFARSEEHTSELQSHSDLVCRLLLEKQKKVRSGRSMQSAHTRPDRATSSPCPSRPIPITARSNRAAMLALKPELSAPWHRYCITCLE